jgi:Kdo2-lipid IVA lauroyltransferase/acyltransferase
MGKSKKRKKIQKGILHFLIFLFFVLFFYMVKILPSVIYPLLSKIAGTLAFYTMRSNRKLILKNMDIVYGNRLNRVEKLRICKEVFTSVVINLCEIIQIGKISEKQLLDMTVIEGEENLKDAFKGKKGVIGVGPHMGNFPRLQVVLNKKGFPTNYFSRPPSGRHLARFFKELISSVMVPLIYTVDMDKAIRQSIKWLKNNGLLGFYIDQHSGSGVEVDFFNRKVFSPTGAAVLARKFNCPVVGLYTYRMHNGKQKIIIEGPYSLQKTDNSVQDIQANTALFMKKIEHYVEEHPEQWFTWLSKRFR